MSAVATQPTEARDYEVVVCDRCRTAACWHGEHMCSDSETAGTRTYPARTLDLLELEHPSNYSVETLQRITGGVPLKYNDPPVPTNLEVTVSESDSTSVKGSFPHYYKAVPPGMSHIDLYAVLLLWEVADPAIAHAVKKLLCSGVRGAKSRTVDLQEARDSITRALELEAAWARFEEEKT